MTNLNKKSQVDLWREAAAESKLMMSVKPELWFKYLKSVTDREVTQ